MGPVMDAYVFGYGIIVIVDPIPTINVVYQAVAIIVYPISRCFPWVGPHVCGQVFMIIVHASVNNADNHVA